MLGLLDWILIAAYLLLALGVGLAVREGSSGGLKSYFLADRSLPWWWAGTSIAATTFAADTPLAVAGIVADRGLSGNWIWLSWMLVHAGVVVVFARQWWRSGVLTDAEFITLRYSDRAASPLRKFRAGLYGIVYNIIILGWVLRAMGKIVGPIFHWQDWTPWLYNAVARGLPEHTALGGPGEFITILFLVIVVTFYSSLGGLRGVVRTDLVQFALGMLGSVWLGVAAWQAAGGRSGLKEGLVANYGERATEFTSLFPSFSGGWLAGLHLGVFALGSYFMVQAFANVPADGGGYLQQRLNAARSEKDAQKAAGLFYVFHYVLRIWPWFVVALAALVLIPLTGASSLPPDLVAGVQADRELAYPALIFALLPEGVVGLLMVSLMAAFMSTIDTHFNWGSSYVVNDLLGGSEGSGKQVNHVWRARWTVVGFAVAALLVATQIDRIEQAWKWIAALGAALGAPTLLRWFWWRVTAASELAGSLLGLSVAAITTAIGLGYERQLVWIGAASLVGTFAMIAVGPPASRAHAMGFAEKVNPMGVWPGRSRGVATGQISRAVAMTAGVIVLTLLSLMAGHWLVLGG